MRADRQTDSRQIQTYTLTAILCTPVNFLIYRYHKAKITTSAIYIGIVKTIIFVVQC